MKKMNKIQALKVRTHIKGGQIEGLGEGYIDEDYLCQMYSDDCWNVDGYSDQDACMNYFRECM